MNHIEFRHGAISHVIQSRFWAMCGSVDRENAEATEQSITLSLLVGGRWFDAVRDHRFGGSLTVVIRRLTRLMATQRSSRCRCGCCLASGG